MPETLPPGTLNYWDHTAIPCPEKIRSLAHESALERQTNYAVTRPSKGERTRIQTFPDGTSSTTAERLGGLVTATMPDGTMVAALSAIDERLGAHATVPVRTSVSTPSGLERVVEVTRTSTSSAEDALDALSVVETTTLQQDAARQSVVTYTRAGGGHPATIVRRTAEGRALQAVLGEGGRVDRVQRGIWKQGAFGDVGIHDVVMSYDDRGRLTGMTQGSGVTMRTTMMAFSADGFVESVTDGAGVLGLDTDAVGRVTTLTLPGGAALGLRYDADGNLEGVTPPARPEHTFVNDGVDRMTRYTPPDVVDGDDFTEYTYNADHALTDVLRPDGQLVSLHYDTAGRVDGVDAGSGDRAFRYWTTGQLRSVAETHGGTTELTWDGALLIGMERTETFEGDVTWTYGEDHSLASETVAGASTVTYGRDNDDLLVLAGAETVGRHAATGAVTGTTLGE